ncbi:hypothetical protein [Mycobacteroides sp. PCS013]|uniref:hypothetical protein n=1 Tax=Mycobacteroides sp. PCS013 TaxID=3074106 RepID=UPI003C2C2203
MTDMNDDQIVTEAFTRLELLRDQLNQIDAARDSQPERLAAARSEADEARGWALIEEPWTELVTAFPAQTLDGKRTGDAITLPSITAKELFGARLAFDLLDCGDDFERIDEVQNRYYAALSGDTGTLFLIAFSALSTIASVVMPQLLEDIEKQGNWDMRVLLASARTKAWRDRVRDIGPEIGDETVQ